MESPLGISRGLFQVPGYLAGRLRLLMLQLKTRWDHGGGLQSRKLLPELPLEQWGVGGEWAASGVGWGLEPGLGVHHPLTARGRTILGSRVDGACAGARARDNPGSGVISWRWA